MDSGRQNDGACSRSAAGNDAAAAAYPATGMSLLALPGLPSVTARCSFVRGLPAAKREERLRVSRDGMARRCGARRGGGRAARGAGMRLGGGRLPWLRRKNNAASWPIKLLLSAPRRSAPLDDPVTPLLLRTLPSAASSHLPFSVSVLLEHCCLANVLEDVLLALSALANRRRSYLTQTLPCSLRLQR